MLVSKRVQLPIQYLLILLLGLLVVISLEVSRYDSEVFLLDFNRAILLTIYYATWILIIRYVNGALTIFDAIQLNLLKNGVYFLSYCFVLVAAHFLISNLIYYVLTELIFQRGIEKIRSLRQIWVWLMMNRFVTLFFLLGILKIIDLYQKGLEKDLNIERIQSKLHLANLEMLKAQINPHFIFNTLHSISSMIGYENTKARNMTIQLSEMLRKNLELNKRTLHEFEEEFQYMKTYLDIQSERFHDRLMIELDVEKDTHDVMVPVLILQPLIENAFTHGLDHLTEKGKFEFQAFLNNDVLSLVMNNSISSEVIRNESTGIGLENVKSRLKEIYKGKAVMIITRSKDIFTIRLDLPIQQ